MSDRVELTDAEREALHIQVFPDHAACEADFNRLHARVHELRDELAAANARCAELQAAYPYSKRLAELTDAGLDDLEAERDALQATLDRVTAVLESVEAINDGGWQPMVENILTKIGTDLRAALTPEGKP